MLRVLRRNRRLDLQAKISLVLVAVIVPTYLVVTLTESKLTRPILESEIKQIAITTGKSLATEIVGQRLLTLANPTPRIESYVQELVYTQPNIIRIDVLVRDPVTGKAKSIASNVEEEPGAEATPFALVEALTSEFRVENGQEIWDVSVPIEQRSRDPRAPRKVLGTVHVVATLKLVDQLAATLFRITATAAGFSVVILFLALSYFLRKTIMNERLLRQAETQNLALTEQLHDAQRQLMNTEKLAVMGQLTASFAHEIGTPLNAIGGHLQLLREEIGPDKPDLGERLEIINGQVGKIEEIVKGFLQSTAKPSSQRQLVDLNRLVDQTLGFVRPRSEALGVEVRRTLDRDLGPVRVVPLEVEQILLNLVNNSLDSLKAKAAERERARQVLEVSTGVEKNGTREWAVVSVYDTGEGIAKSEIHKVLKPFYTTKPPGEGTGLGLTICQQLARKYGGVLEIDSKEGSWTRVTLKLPYDA